jgi:hypothetical protein
MAMLERAAIPMAFIGGPLNLQSIPAELVDRKEFKAQVPNSFQYAVYVNVCWRQPNRKNDDFIFFVDQSVSLEQAAPIIQSNFFK